MRRPHAQNTIRGVVVSDLHLFARRSDGEKHLHAVRAKLARADVLVLNGDTFDFRWSTLSDHQASVNVALEWLGNLLDSYPNLHVHLVLGNHDWLLTFQKKLAAFSSTRSRLSYHEHVLQLGSALFLHGDCVERNMNAHDLCRYRQVWENDRQRGSLSTALYVASDRFGITQLAHRRHFPRDRTVGRIAYYLDQSLPAWRGTVRDCYFGHTHVPFTEHEQGGVAFHNTGSGIRNMGFNPINFEVTQQPE